jgi:hypothetical protein
VAVEDSLTPIRQYLQEKGYEVVSLRPGHKADAAVISGGDKDVMGIQTVAGHAAGRGSAGPGREMAVNILAAESRPCLMGGFLCGDSC